MVFLDMQGASAIMYIDTVGTHSSKVFHYLDKYLSGNNHPITVDTDL